MEPSKMLAAVSFTVRIRTRSAANLREHWGSRAKRAKAERSKTLLAWVASGPAYKRHLPKPCVVTLTRIAPRALDIGDNLPVALKAVRDEVASILHVDDADPRVTWTYAQERGKPREYAVRVEVRPAGDHQQVPVAKEKTGPKTTKNADLATSDQPDALVPRVRPEGSVPLEELNRQLAKTDREVDALMRKLRLEDES